VRVRLIADLTQSLAWLHANPRLMAAHRHLLITPSTIVIGLDGVARIDVRAAKKQISERSEQEVDYLAPEVLSGDPAADHRSDIFSVGVLSWEALAGQRLADSSSAAWADDYRSRARAASETRGDLASEIPATLASGSRSTEATVGSKSCHR
jgi:serine/threonine protein kinase